MSCERIGIGQEIGEDDNHIEEDNHHGRRHGQFVLAKTPPHELPLGSDRRLFSSALMSTLDFGRLWRIWRSEGADSVGHQLLPSMPWRMRGSIHIRIRSEMKVPMTVKHRKQQQNCAGQKEVLRQQ